MSLLMVEFPRVELLKQYCSNIQVYLSDDDGESYILFGGSGYKEILEKNNCKFFYAMKEGKKVTQMSTLEQMQELREQQEGAIT